MIGVQFHPEIFTAAGDTTMHKLFKFLVNKADTFNLAKKFTAAFYPLTLIQILLFGLKRLQRRLEKRQHGQHPQMEEGKLDAQFLAAFIWQGKRDDVSSQKP